MEINLKNKVALVTGCPGRFGEKICLELAEAGAKVWIHSFNEYNQAEQICSKIHAFGGTAYMISGDLANPEAAKTVVRKIVKQSGTIDILVNHAEIQSVKALTDLSPEDWLETVDANLDVPFLCCREALPYMVEAGKGFIVNISSTAAISGDIGSHYAASKSALNSMTKGLAKEYRKYGIKVNGIAPAFMANNKKQTDLQKAVANTVLLLCSTPYTNFTNGKTLLLEEGEVVQ